MGVIPCDETGEKNLAQEMDEEGADIVEDPKQLLDREMYFKINITNANLPDNFCRNTFVEYTILDNEGKQATFKTEMVNSFAKETKFFLI